MRKIFIVLAVLFTLNSCVKDDDCSEVVDEIYRYYCTLIKAERLGNNRPDVIQALEEERDREAIIACQ